MGSRKDPEQARRRILALRDSLYPFFVGKNHIIDLMAVAAVAQEPLLLVGQPGTAKSDLALKFAEAMGITGGDYFEYMLTEFTEPSEILGALDLGGLREGRFTRRTEGKLPVARVAFLDEIFNSSSAILNVLLTILNERKYYDDGRAVAVPLKLLFAATNEIPDHSRMSALRDRFCIKVESQPVRALEGDAFSRLIDAGLRNESWKQSRLKPWQAELATLEDFLLAHEAILAQMGQVRSNAFGEPERTDRELFMPAEVQALFRNLIETMAREHRIFVSDRKVVKMYKVLRAKAWLERNGEIRREDLGLLAYLGENLDQLGLLRQKIPQYIGLES